MKRTLPLIVTVLCFVTPLLAQENNPLINSGEVISAGSKLHDEGKYKEALREYQKVNASDTNYVLALYEMSVTCSADSQFTQGLRYCEEALARTEDRERLPDLLSQKSILLDYIGQSDKALQLLDSAIAAYPAFMPLYVTKGTTLLRLEKYPEAAAVFQKALLIDPYSASSHFKLGLCALYEGNSMAAFLSFSTYLLIAPGGQFANRTIGLLSSISQNKDDIAELVTNRKQEPSDNFKLVEQIVQSKIALDKNYKPIIKLDDAISRQLQVILEKVTYDEQDKDFWMQFYVPYYRKVFEGHKFEYLVNYIFSGVDVPAIKEFNQKNKKAIQEFTDEAVAYLNIIRATRELQANKRNMEGGVYFFENGKLTGKGITKNNGQILTGSWDFYYPAGNKKANGVLNEKGEKEGVWNYYYFAGQLRGTENYVAGKQEGKEVFYYDSGIPSSRSNYKNGLADGESIAYYKDGAVKSREMYKAGELDGTRTVFFKSGITQTTENYQAGKLNGLTRSAYANGKTNGEVRYVNGVLSGPYKTWYADGTLSGEGQYDQDKLTGIVKRYHENGKPNTIEAYADGRLEGEHAEYWDNGQLLTKYLNRKGKTSGEVNYYNREGKLFSIFTYDDDRLRKAKYFDKAGKEISSSEIRDGKLELVAYNVDGFKKSVSIYTKKSVAEGPQTYYYSTGKPSETSNYQDGTLSGLSTSYHPNGQQASALNYTEGRKHGYYNNYYMHGVKSQEGWYQDDLAQGTWIFYNQLGVVTSKVFYLNDEWDGIKTDYWPNGNKQTVYLYDMGRMLESVQYDTTGKEIHRSKPINGNGKFTNVHLNGKASSEATYKEGEPDGVNTFYYFDGSVQTKQFFKKGLLDSVYKAYHYGGKPSQEGQYKLNEKTGTWKNYTTDGILYYTEVYKDGKLNGKRTYYFENGKVDTEIEYVNDERDGTMKKYTREGLLMYQITYREGLPITYSYLDKTGKPVPDIALPAGNGKVNTFYANGNKSSEFEYSDGKINGVYNTFHADGKPWLESAEVFGISEGTLKEFYPNGSLKSQYNYLHDNVHGAFRELYEKGITKQEGTYYNGQLHGPLKRYDEQGKLKETMIYYYGELISITK
jgi:antitoxin component YwqK of YwqJK toxin-antitoxin module/Flp pilus assembly protein TadD